MSFMPIDSIVVDRQLRPNDSVDTLAKSILDQGLTYPVLILANRYLVDGLRRLEASKLAGFTTIDVVIANTFEDAVDALALSHRDTPPKRLDYPPWRLNEIWQAVIGLPHRGRVGQNSPSRALMSAALHVSSDNLIQSTVYTYRTAEQPGPEGDIAREAIRLMEAGIINGYGGRMRLYNYREAGKLAEGDMPKPIGRRVITQAVANLGGITKGLRRVPVGLEAEIFNPDEARALGYELEQARKILVAMAGRLRKIYKSEGTTQ
jgi:hypothetical protein